MSENETSIRDALFAEDCRRLAQIAMKACTHIDGLEREIDVHIVNQLAGNKIIGLYKTTLLAVARKLGKWPGGGFQKTALECIESIRLCQAAADAVDQDPTNTRLATNLAVALVEVDLAEPAAGIDVIQDSGPKDSPPT